MQTQVHYTRQINHKTMRVIIGAIALLLSPTVLLIAQVPGGLPSISDSYWTGARDVFVGALIVVGFFLSAYNGTGEKRDWEYRISRVACFFALCVALFPTASGDLEKLPADWVLAITTLIGVEVTYIHYGAAVMLFACLVALMWFFSARAFNKGESGRAYFYRTVSFLMAGGIALIQLFGDDLGIPNKVFVVEVWGLTWFGIGWLVAGAYKTKGPSPELTTAPSSEAQFQS